jgi:hypothetical protein
MVLNSASEDTLAVQERRSCGAGQKKRAVRKKKSAAQEADEAYL